LKAIYVALTPESDLPTTPAPNTPAPNQSPFLRGTDHLRERAESLIAALSDADAVAGSAAKSSLELIVDGYAHVLALDVDRLRLEREIARLTESVDSQVAGELQELAILLRLVQSTSVELRGLLDAVRAHVECRA
jgi:hypothetical protein